jgi:hypothetical protein
MADTTYVVFQGSWTHGRDLTTGEHLKYTWQKRGHGKDWKSTHGRKLDTAEGPSGTRQTPADTVDIWQPIFISCQYSVPMIAMRPNLCRVFALMSVVGFINLKPNSAQAFRLLYCFTYC